MIRRRRDDELAPIDWWGPYSTPVDMLEQMDRMFEDLREGFESRLLAPNGIAARGPKMPAIDLVDEGGEYRLLAEMPGLRKEDVSIEVGDSEIRISAETNLENEENDADKGYIRRERQYSKIYRRVPLPESVRADKTIAELRDGVLTVRLPKTERAGKKPKRIEVR